MTHALTTTRRRFARICVVFVMFLAAIVGAAPAHATTAPHCGDGQVPLFGGAVDQLARNLGPKMGTPVECVHPDPDSGDLHQQTSTGLAFVRQGSQVAVFTDGFRKWAVTDGRVLSWLGSVNDPPPGARALLATDGVATVHSSGWANVVEITGPERFVARNDRGDLISVWHAGIIGPIAAQGDWRDRGIDLHGKLLPIRQRVWLDVVEDIVNPPRSEVVRHVFTAGSTGDPVAAQLLRSGMVWVFPHSMHSFAELYAERQAEAVVTRTGAWADTNTSDVYRPRGTERGGIPINPRLRPILDAMDADDVGNSVLRAVNRFPVEVGINRTTNRIVGYFSGRFYTVQVSENAAAAPPEAVAGVLVHEITHANQMIEKGLSGEDAGCFGKELEAFEAAAKYWQSVYGPNGKRQTKHWLDDEMNRTLRQYRDGTLSRRVNES